ncbi:hypothetical protein VNO77_15626 [Canavalia gladiata]|uniref:Uncharacterized protein n=1 Tax=Canavalia gladiata TaxID=3824 RepID=A0AAN9QPA5_CANGL
MFSPSHHKTSHPLQLFSAKSQPPPPPPSSSSALSSMKIKNLILTRIMYRILRALSKVKAVIIDILKGNQSTIYFNKKHYSTKISKKIIFGSFRLHYNWCSSKSSHVLPVPSRIFQGLLPKASATHWNTTVTVIDSAEELEEFEDCHDDSQLAGYLQWLEEKFNDDEEEEEINKIDMLAEMFIANCHEKFKLEKQESDRRFQEMLARGM